MRRQKKERKIMSPLEISTAAMSANSGSLIIVCAVASAVILIVSFLHERLKAFNAKHSIITYSDNLVRPVSWNGGKDGIDIDGIPYYGSYENEDEDTPVWYRDKPEDKRFYATSSRTYA